MEYAATNDIIVLWPFVEDCYDTETHKSVATNDDYATRDGVQPKAFFKMIERLTSDKF